MPNAFDASNLWGPSTFDRRHVLVMNAIYQLPFFKDKSNCQGKLLGGWTLSAVSQLPDRQPVATIGTERRLSPASARAAAASSGSSTAIRR